MAFIIFLIAGAISGTLAGLLGIGGGLLFVPVMLFLLPQFGIPPNLIMHVAVSTSLAIISFTSLSSTRAHHKRGGIDWKIVKVIAPGVIIGAIIGAITAHSLPGHFLQKTFAIFALLIGLKLLFHWQPSAKRQLPKRKGLTIFGLFQGILCALLGMGGGAIAVPFFQICQVDIRKAVAMSSALGFCISITAALAAMLTGLNTPNMPAWSTGYIFWPAFFGLMPTAFICAPLGARLAHWLPTPILTRIFAVFLFLVALDMWFH